MNHRVWVNVLRRRPVRFGEVCGACDNRVFLYTLKRTGDYHVARDVMSGTLLKALLDIQRFRWKRVNLVVFLFQIALNEMRYVIRDRRELQNTVQLKWRPLLWISVGLLVFLVFSGYLVLENLG